MTNSTWRSPVRPCRAHLSTLRTALLSALLPLLCLPLAMHAQQAPSSLARLQLTPACAPPLAENASCRTSGGAAFLHAAGDARLTLPVRAATERTAVRRDRRTARLVGAVAGFVVGAGATYFVTRTGGSTSLCDRDRNQDALNARECAGLTLLGGAVGAGIGFVIGGAVAGSD